MKSCNLWTWVNGIKTDPGNAICPWGLTAVKGNSPPGGFAAGACNVGCKQAQRPNGQLYCA